MASYKSHINPPRRVEDQTPYTYRTNTTRLPQRSVTPTSTITSQLPTPSHSKLQKRKPTRHEQAQPSRGASSHRGPVAKPSLVGKGRQGNNTTTVVSSSRLPKLEVVGTTRTPSLVSGSSTSTVDSPRSNVLRRKPTSIGVMTGKQGSSPREDSLSSQEEEQPMRILPGEFKDPFSETVLGISLPTSSSILVRSDPEFEILGSRYGEYEAGPTEILPLPTPLYALSTTPSTRDSESPGPFSISSTPTSMSSYSPGVTLSTKSTSRLRQASPLQSRPPVVRHRTPDETSLRQQHVLSAVRESSTSSSSTSTILVDGNKQRERQAQHRLPAPPPSPPTHIRSPDTANNGLSPTPANSSKRPVQAPPELAHLADRGPTSPPESRRPTRPSRDGTPEIGGLRGPSPIIQSNITSFPSAHRRTSSTESKSSMMASGRTRFGIPSKSSSRNPSPNPSLPSGVAPVSRVPTRGPTPDTQNNVDKQRSQTLPSSKSGTAPSPNKTSRFGFFRRTKTEPAPVPKAENKLHRRGPAAGTGHEGYGRYANRGRSGSSVSGTSIGRSASAGTTTESLNRTPSSRKSSMTSTTSTEMDEFFLERLAPVTIRGTGSSTELSRSPEAMRSESSLEVASASGEKPNNNPASFASRSALEKGRPTLLPSAMSDSVRGSSPVKKMPLGKRRPSESDDDTKKSFLPSLATRRASRTSKSLNGAPLSKVTSNGSTTEKNRSGTKLNNGASDGQEGKWLKSKKKAEKAPSKPSKWNFFQRAHAGPKVESPALDSSPASNRVLPSRSVAHYALMDSQSGIDLDDIEQLMQEADSAPEEPLPSTLTEDRMPSSQESAPKDRLQSILLPPRPILPSDFAPPARSASPKVFLHPGTQPQMPQRKLVIETAQGASIPPAPLSQSELTPVTDLSPSTSPFRPLSPVENATSNEQVLPTAPIVPPESLSSPEPPPSNPPPRPSRLAQVGRIPQVVSRRNQERRPPSQSFSRPFGGGQPRPNMASRTSFDSATSLTATAGPVEPYPVLQGLDALSHGSAIATLSPSAEESNRQSEFFKFPPRKDSEVSYSSSSGVWSFPPTSFTAVIPGPGSPQSEDEVWNEYNDLIDEVLSPIEDSPCDTKDLSPSRHPSLEPLPLKTKASRTSAQSGGSIVGVSNPSLHLRRSRLLAVLHSAQSPTSPTSFSDFIQEYGDRNLSVVDPVTGRLSFPSPARVSTGSGPKTRPGSARSSLPASLTLSARQSKATLASSSDKDRESATANRYRDSRLMELAETQSDGLVSMANLRFGALMTSKWLSFGRVLFSPAHFELKDPVEDRVLVVDGLGKDWSYYCALTYPEATVFNLGPGLSSSATPNNTSEPWSTLRNHHHISHESLASPFPFSKGHFACVVLRFPPALPSSVHKSVISECKRVLRPGGHLEISVLDLDLVNMGNRARRAVRGLKVKMQIAEENISLRNISDEIMAGLGRKGFIECNRCFVGVPVAGRLPSPEDLDTSANRKRKGSTTSSLGKKSVSSRASKQPKAEVSFSDLLSTQSSSESTDNGITDMVARVGRWWYSRCYESLVLPEAGKPGAAGSGNLLESSIWRDESLIRECEKRGTSFRLLIGYAQKPEVGVRRTVSV